MSEQRYEFRSIVTDLHCDKVDVTPLGSRFREYVAVYWFDINGLRVPVADRNALPMPGTTVRVCITWESA